MNQDLYNVIRNQLRHTNCYCITGDSNFRDINWSTMSSNISEEKHFLQMLNEENMIQNVFEPTRLNAILDLCLTPNDDSISDLKVNETFSTSDHACITFKFSPPINFQKKIFIEILKTSITSFSGLNWQLLTGTFTFMATMTVATCYGPYFIQL